MKSPTPLQKTIKTELSNIFKTNYKNTGHPVFYTYTTPLLELLEPLTHLTSPQVQIFF